MTPLHVYVFPLRIWVPNRTVADGQDDKEADETVNKAVSPKSSMLSLHVISGSNDIA